MANIRNLAPGATELDQVWGTRPGFYAVFMDDYQRSVARVDPSLIELCRLRMATILGSAFDLGLRYQPAAEAGLSEARIAALAEYAASPLFTERERLCIGFAELFVIQSSSIGDADVAQVQAALGAEQFIYFVKALSVIDQLQRSCVAFDVQPGASVPSTLAQFRAVEAVTA
jgi:alkylhydroperoxidase family enzyme